MPSVLSLTSLRTEGAWYPGELGLKYIVLVIAVWIDLLFVNYSLEMAKVCAIFGGSRGIGKGVAQLLVQKGYRLAIIARNLEVAQTTADHLGGTYVRFVAILFACSPVFR